MLLAILPNLPFAPAARVEQGVCVCEWMCGVRVWSGREYFLKMENCTDVKYFFLPITSHSSNRTERTSTQPFFGSFFSWRISIIFFLRFCFCSKWKIHFNTPRHRLRLRLRHIISLDAIPFLSIYNFIIHFENLTKKRRDTTFFSIPCLLSCLWLAVAHQHHHHPHQTPGRGQNSRNLLFFLELWTHTRAHSHRPAGDDEDDDDGEEDADVQHIIYTTNLVIGVGVGGVAH